MAVARISQGRITYEDLISTTLNRIKTWTYPAPNDRAKNLSTFNIDPLTSVLGRRIFPVIITLTRGKSAVKSFAAEMELAEMLVQMVARAKAKEAKNAAARLSQLSISLKEYSELMSSLYARRTDLRGSQ